MDAINNFGFSEDQPLGYAVRRPPAELPERPFFALHVTTDDMAAIPAPTPETWGPTPLHPFLVPDQQKRILSDIQYRSLDGAPASIPYDVRGNVAYKAETRFVGRMLANYDNLKYAERLGTPLSRVQAEIVDRALAGVANPAELVYISDVLGMRGIALGVVSHPYGVGIEHLDTMRDVIGQTMELFGAERIEGQTVYKVKGTIEDRDGRVDAVLMTRKRTIGRLASHMWFRERSSFIVRLDDAAELDRHAVHLLHAHTKRKNMQDIAAVEGDEIYEVVNPLLVNNQYHTAIPLATTDYKFDSTIPKPTKIDATGTVRHVGEARRQSPLMSFEQTETRLKAQGVPLDIDSVRAWSLEDLID